MDTTLVDEKLKEIWENPEQSSSNSETPSGVAEDASDWEKRLESVADDGAAKEEAKEEPPKKKGLFGRKKK